MTPEQALQFLANAAAKVIVIEQLQNFNAAITALNALFKKPEDKKAE